MKTTIFLLIICFNTCKHLQAQDSALVVQLWKSGIQKNTKELGTHYQVSPDLDMVKMLYEKKPAKISFAFTGLDNNVMVADLELDIMHNVKVKLNNRTYVNDVLLPIFYRGKIKGVKGGDNVMLTIAPGFVSFQAMLPGANIYLEKANNGYPDSYLLYNSKEMLLPEKKEYCGLPPAPLNFAKQKKIVSKNDPVQLTNTTNKCIFVYVDCTQELFVHYGSSAQNTINNIYSIWNDVKTAYIQEQLNVGISEINIWTSPDPFNTSTRDLGIQTFAAYYQDAYWGNMAMLLDWNPTGNLGIAGGYGWLKGLAPGVCGNYNPTPSPSWNHGSFIYNDLNYGGNYDNFPVPARSAEVYLFVHEIGHLLGSHHTHWCGWLLSTNPDVFGAIDNCNAVEGTCSAGPTPVNGGTFMSYCINTGEFVNFSNGFGALPGQAIRDFVSASTCVANCVGCSENLSLGAIPTPGIYQYEANNQITANGVINGNPSTIVKIDGRVRVILSPGFKALQGGEVNIFTDGCGGIR